MKHEVFTIVFFCNNCFDYNDGECGSYRYEAVITVISESFRLFHAGKIKRFNPGGTLVLFDNYYLTSYPHPDYTNYTWRDAVTFNRSEFLEVIGNTIDEYLAGRSPLVRSKFALHQFTGKSCLDAGLNEGQQLQ